MSHYFYQVNVENQVRQKVEIASVEYLTRVGEETGNTAPIGSARSSSPYCKHASTFTTLVTSLLLCLPEREPAEKDAAASISLHRSAFHPL